MARTYAVSKDIARNQSSGKTRAEHILADGAKAFLIEMVEPMNVRH